VPVNAILSYIPKPNPRLILSALFAVVALHICATLAAPAMTLSTPYSRLVAGLPTNTMRILPTITPDTQPFPFLAPDVRIAVCKFDTSKQTVQLNTSLLSLGWTLSLYNMDGESFYTAVGEPGRRVNIALILVPEQEQFQGLTPEARGERSELRPELRVPASKGLAVLRAADAGFAYKARTESELKRAFCGPSAAPRR
jgi:uncharacterized membrane protein